MRAVPSSVTWRLVARITLISLTLGLALGGCHRGDAEAARPAATLADSAVAQAEFRRIQRDWLALPPGERAQLEEPLQAFLDRYPLDDLARTARVYLAFILIRGGRLDEARRLIEPVRRGPQGSVRDFAAVADGGILIREGRPEEALRLLQPLRGKIVDPAERLLFGEQLVHAALESDRWSAATAAMIEWIAEADPEHQAGVQAAVALLVQRIPAPALERVLGDLDAAAASRSEATSRAPARDFLREVVRGHLSQVALRRRDTELAQRLVESGPATLLQDESGLALLALASSGHIDPRVAGRSVGLLLSVHSERARRRSAAAAAGIARALGLPAASRGGDSVRLLLRDATGPGEGVVEALAGLAGDGAAILVAGVTEADATVAQEFAERVRIPVVLLHPATTPPAADGFTFMLGEEQQRVVTALTSTMESGGAGQWVVLRDIEDTCSAASAGLGPPRLPVATWSQTGVTGVVLLGDEGCVRELVGAVDASRFRPRFGLGLEATTAVPELSERVPLVVVAAGSYPAPPGFAARLSDPGPRPQWLDWYDALGQDAGTLARTVLRQFPLERIEDLAVVARLHRRARDELAVAAPSLATTQARGFAGRRVIARELTGVLVDPPGPGTKP